MKNNKIIYITILLIIIISFTIIIMFKNNNEKENNGIFINEYEEVDKNQISYKENVTVNELKEETGIDGDTNIYDIQTEYDGRKVLTVKNNLKFKVAFCGIIIKDIPQMKELDDTLIENLPQKNGIWIENYSRDKILDLINNSKKTNSQYAINGEGYLNIIEKNNQTEVDKKIQQAINSDNLYILTKSSICYIVDDVTGEILDYNFEKMDIYQSYEYFEDNNKKMIFITENSGNQLNNEDILEDVINLF